MKSPFFGGYFSRGCCLEKKLNASRLAEHPPVRGENVKTFRREHRLLLVHTFSV